MNANAEILLIKADGSVILQERDDKPGITNPGLISSFGGHIEEGEEPLDAAVREINEETNLKLSKEDLQFYRKCHKTKAVHGEDWDVYYFAAVDVREEGLEVYEGKGYTVIHDTEELERSKASILLREVLTDYFEGFRSFIFQPDIPRQVLDELFKKHYAAITSGKVSAATENPIALACTGLVAAGKSTVTAPLAETIGAVQVSSDHIREMFFKAGYNFKEVRPFIARLLDRLAEQKYNIYLDFNISTNIKILDKLTRLGFKVYIIHANPPEEFIKEKILSGSMKHELTFFAKDAHVYESMLGWKEEHEANLPELKRRYGIWSEVDTSRDDLQEVMNKLLEKFIHEVRR